MLFEIDPFPTVRKTGKRKYLKNNVSEGVRELEKELKLTDARFLRDG